MQCVSKAKRSFVCIFVLVSVYIVCRLSGLFNGLHGITCLISLPLQWLAKEIAQILEMTLLYSSASRFAEKLVTGEEFDNMSELHRNITVTIFDDNNNNASARATLKLRPLPNYNVRLLGLHIFNGDYNFYVSEANFQESQPPSIGPFSSFECNNFFGCFWLLWINWYWIPPSLHGYKSAKSLCSWVWALMM